MKLSEKLQLIKAGYSKKEIQELEKEEAEQQAEPEPAEPSQEPVQEPAPVENPVETVDSSEAILAAIQELRGAVQAMNIRRDQQPDPPERSGEDVIKSLIGGKDNARK